VEDLQNYHYEIFGPAPRKGAGIQRTVLRIEFINFIKKATDFFPEYITKKNFELCRFPEDGSYDVEDLYRDISSAVTFFCNGSQSNTHKQLNPPRSIFATLPPPRRPISPPSATRPHSNKKKKEKEYVVTLNQPFFSAGGFFLIFIFIFFYLFLFLFFL
jgi:hypothetical protein